MEHVRKSLAAQTGGHAETITALFEAHLAESKDLPVPCGALREIQSYAVEKKQRASLCNTELEFGCETISEESADSLGA